MHSSVTDSSNIGAVSYMAVQVFEHWIGLQFRAIPQSLQTLQAKRFALVPSNSFLCAMHSTPEELFNGGLKISQTDSALFKYLTENKLNVFTAIKTLNYRVKNLLDTVEGSL